MPPLILAHDLGTTGNKATLFDVDGSVVASTFAGYETRYAQANWAEQNPADWRQALFDSTRHLIGMARAAGYADSDVAVVSFSGHMNGALVVDAAGEPLRPAIIWADQRATAQADVIRERCGEDETYRLTGNRISPAYTAAKLLWIKEHQPEVYRRIYKVLQAKDYAAFLFAGILATDYSDASLTLMLDLAGRRWAEPMLERLGIDAELLPPNLPSSQVVGEVTAAAAAATGLRPGTPVVIGGGDGACATVGAGAVRCGDAYNYVGSSSWVAMSTLRPVLDPLRRTFNFVHLDPDLNVALGTMQAAGGAFDWFERLVRAEASTESQYGALDEAAGQVPPGSRNLLFLPYLLGERSPHWNPLARGAFVGLAMPHGRGELARAVLEGVAFNLRQILEIMASAQQTSEVTQDLRGLRLIGGGGKSALWRQILADVYGLPIEQLSLPAQATALGAAIVGGVGVGLFPSYAVTRQLAPALRMVHPNPVTRPVYDALYVVFKDTYAALAPIFERLAELPSSG
jgi:xylulokinase